MALSKRYKPDVDLFVSLSFTLRVEYVSIYFCNYVLGSRR